jgi:hypothetical protein
MEVPLPRCAWIAEYRFVEVRRCRLPSLHLTQKENTMPQSTHDPVAELHNLAAHAHTAAAEAHGKGDHLTAQELTKKAHEHSWNAYKHAGELLVNVANSHKE